MITQPSHPRLRSGPAMRKGGKRLGRLTTALAAFTAGLVVSTAAATAALASPKPVQEGGDIEALPKFPGRADSCQAREPVKVRQGAGHPPRMVTVISQGPSPQRVAGRPALLDE